jgi:hypothetical protein
MYYFFKVNTKISTSFRHVQIVFCRNSCFHHLNKALIIKKIYLIQTNFGFIVCYDIDHVHIEIISIQKLIKKKNYDKIQFECEIIDAVRSSYIQR